MTTVDFEAMLLAMVDILARSQFDVDDKKIVDTLIGGRSWARVAGTELAPRGPLHSVKKGVSGGIRCY